jgi:hypothetical protein
MLRRKTEIVRDSLSLQQFPVENPKEQLLGNDILFYG